MMFAFRSLIGKFLERDLYWVNPVVNSFCVVLTLAQNPLKEFLNVKGRVLLEVFRELSNWEVQQNRFEITGVSYRSVPVFDMLVKVAFT